MNSPGPAFVDARAPRRPRAIRTPVSGWRKATLIAIFCVATAAATWTAIHFGRTWLDRSKTITFSVTRDGPDRKFAEKLARVMASNNEFIRIAVMPSDDPFGAFTRRESDLVIARSDAKLPGWSRSIANIEKEIVLLIARKGVAAEAPSDLKKFGFALFSPSATDETLLRSIFSAYEFGRDDRQLNPLANVETAVNALRTSPAKLIVAVAPLSKLVQGHLLDGLPQKTPIALLDWPDSKALATKVRGLSDETIDIGLFSVSPLLPADDLETVALTDLLLTRNQLRESTVAEIAKTIFGFRNDLAIEGAFATSIEPPDTDKDAEVLAHPGAVQYVNDDEKTFLDRYSDLIYISMPIASVFGSLFLYVYTRLTRVKPMPAGELADEVLSVAARVRAAQSEDELVRADERLDEILHETLRDLQARRLTSEGLDVFRLAYEQTREWIKVKRRALAERHT